MTTDTPGRLGIFGGSFDPVHYGHLLLAESCREQCHLDQVWLLPAASAPHKLQRADDQLPDIASRCCGWRSAVTRRCASARWKSIAVASATRSKRLKTIHQQLPTRELFFLMGADSLEDLPHWREPQRICQLAVPVVVRRAGSPEPVLGRRCSTWSMPSGWRCSKACQVTMPLIDLASTDMRQRVAQRPEHSLSHAARRREVHRDATACIAE